MGDHYFGYIKKLGRKKKSLLTIAIESIIIIIIIILFLKNLVKFPHLAKDPHFCCYHKIERKNQFESFLHSINKERSFLGALMEQFRKMRLINHP
jgi:hypothetical protein